MTAEVEARNLISPDDRHLYRITDERRRGRHRDPRLLPQLPLAALGRRHAGDPAAGPPDRPRRWRRCPRSSPTSPTRAASGCWTGPLPPEARSDDVPDLPRIGLRFDRVSYRPPAPADRRPQRPAERPADARSDGPTATLTEPIVVAPGGHFCGRTGAERAAPARRRATYPGRRPSGIGREDGGRLLHRPAGPGQAALVDRQLGGRRRRSTPGAGRGRGRPAPRRWPRAAAGCRRTHRPPAHPRPSASADDLHGMAHRRRRRRPATSSSPGWRWPPRRRRSRAMAASLRSRIGPASSGCRVL